VLDEDQARLQGWATVENATDEDWQNVDLTLVSGRPISFIMDLYTPLYVPRPTVVPELYASLRPPTYEGDLEADEDARKLAALDYVGSAERGAETKDAAMARQKARVARYMIEAPPPAPQVPGEALGLAGAAGLASLASAEQVGEVFTYHIATPVTLRRQQSAMLPIVNDSIPAERTSIYNPAVQDKFPLLGLQLENSTGLTLMQGPITVYDGDTYAGDARLPDLSAKDKRLISYALDLDCEVKQESKAQPAKLVSVRIQKGTLIARSKYSQQTEYTLRNKSERKRTLLIERPIDVEWDLVEPAEPFEKARDVYRFRQVVEPQTTAKLLVRQERHGETHVALMDGGLDDIRFYLKSDVISPRVLEALGKVVSMRAELDRLIAEAGLRQNQIQAIESDQDRIRENMSRLNQTSELFVRYVNKLDEQETQMENLREQIAQLDQQQAAQRQSLQDYLLTLNIE
jgi:hypothetical protein